MKTQYGHIWDKHAEGSVCSGVTSSETRARPHTDDPHTKVLRDLDINPNNVKSYSITVSAQDAPEITVVYHMNKQLHANSIK